VKCNNAVYKNKNYALLYVFLKKLAGWDRRKLKAVQIYAGRWLKLSPH
jgi:hypothetical protein